MKFLFSLFENKSLNNKYTAVLSIPLFITLNNLLSSNYLNALCNYPLQNYVAVSFYSAIVEQYQKLLKK